MRRVRKRKRSQRQRALGVVLWVSLVLVAGNTMSCVFKGAEAPPHPWPLSPAIEGAPVVRVALARDAAHIDVEVVGGYTLWEAGAQAPIARGDRLPVTRIVANGQGLQVGDAIFVPAYVRIVPELSGSLRVAEQGYRGNLVVTAADDGKLLVINKVDLESYTAGVLGNEMPLSFPEQSLCAQAIAARSYAFYQLRTRRRSAYDVSNTASSQVYKGLKRETDTARRVVNDTFGIIMVTEGRIFPAYYHSTCGGDTVPASWYFGEPVSAPLSGGKCGYCDGTKYFRWRYEIPKKDAAAKLARYGIRGALTSVAIARRGPANFVLDLSVEHGGGVTTVTAKQFRRGLGTSRVRSPLFDIEDGGESLVIRGAGWGHGVGMCQMGARGMGKAGFDVRAIIGHYYPGAQLMKLYPIATEGS